MPPERRWKVAHIEKSIVIDAPIERVFGIAAQVERIPEWFPIDVRNSSVKVAEKGGTYEWTYTMLGMKFDGKGEFVEVTPGERVYLKTEGGIPSTFDYRYAREGDAKTRVSVTIDYEVPGKLLGKIADKLIVERVNENTAEHALKNLKSLCEI